MSDTDVLQRLTVNQALACRRVFDEGPDVVRKEGSVFRLRREVEAMEFVASRTSIPVPQIIETHLDTESPSERRGPPNWIRMKRMPGQSLGDAWPSMTESARERTESQLKSYIQELRRLPSSYPGCICSCSGGPAYDHRIDNMETCGPFASIGEFHDSLVAPVRKSPRPDWAEKYRKRLPDAHAVVFSHADLSWENVLVDAESGDVTAVLDWEMAGFWPEWWEYRKALYGSRPQRWWMDVLGKIMEKYDSETEADMDLEMF
ncbi:phosphotransferase enzyme family domain-containing protein [Purpureocillium lilacinum]|uniref:Phosphotransferase enzyme family domain-containing protein n=1 Tax=Purpureocillium lilacinum TaxID=33203 RepID=A0A179HBK2_PURLI|nr:phosphotransferase enzyme family domain-containing protein [Purpureocillium lilacinum]GJN66354.1 hypothetical protein PLICBS_000372 [Purpureocillium lilacinum]